MLLFYQPIYVNRLLWAPETSTNVIIYKFKLKNQPTDKYDTIITYALYTINNFHRIRLA